VNIAADPEGLAELRRLGARSIPVVSRGDKFTFAQQLSDVVEFLGLQVDVSPALSPEQLATRLDHVLATAERLVRQIPAASLGDKLPNRDRTLRVLTHHIFRISEAFLEATEGAEFTAALPVVPPSDDLQSFDAIADYGVGVRKRVAAWWAYNDDKACQRRMKTYYGEPRMHEVLERTTWHTAQHVRQIRMVLETRSIVPNRPLSEADLKGLPVPDKVWDD
jgi:hypothetical protein